MAKSKTVFFCSQCGYETVKWLGQCPGCRQWNTLVEEKVSTGKNNKIKKALPHQKLTGLFEVSME